MMIEPFITAISGLFENFTIKRFLGLCCAFSILIIAIVFYEKYTNNFELNRLQKSADILLTLQEAKSKNIDENKELLLVYKNIENQLAALTDPQNPSNTNYTPENAGIKKFSTAVFPWFLMALAVYPQLKKKPETAPTVLIGFAMLGTFFGWLGYMIPTLFWPWFNLVIYPIGHISLFVLPAIIIPNIKSYRRRAEEVKAGLTRK